jgi:DUF3085 family protein
VITLRFPLAGVLRLAEHTLTATTHAASMREVLTGVPPRPALWLVGDLGLFLMSNGLLSPADAEHGTDPPIVYAAGATPARTSGWPSPPRSAAALRCA